VKQAATIKRRQLKRFCFFVIILQLMAPALSAQYYLEKTPDAIGKYNKTAHSLSSMQANDKTTATQLLNAIVEVVKKVYPHPVGADIGPYGGNAGIFKVSEFKNGPFVFHMTIPFFELYKTKNGSIEASGEYSSNINIWINTAKYILQANPVEWGNDLVFRAPKPGIAVNGFPKYNNMVLLLPSGKNLPWRPATKQEYLENFIAALKASFPGRTSIPAERETLARAEQLLASMSAQEKKQVAYLRKIKYSGYKEGYSDLNSNKWAGFQNETDTTAEQLVIINEHFYDKNLPRSSFQLMVIYRRHPRATYSVFRPTAEQINIAKSISERLNSIVRHKNFLSSLQQLLGKEGILFASALNQGKTQLKTVVERPVIKNIDHIIDSLLRNYRPGLPVIAGASLPPIENTPVKEPIIPPPNSKKIALAARKINTKEELLQYLDELDKKISGVLAGTNVAGYAATNTNIIASYGYWLSTKPRESLLLAIKAARQQPDNNTALNNLASTLSLCGIDYLSVPLYIVCMKKEPGNSTLLNNVGQSWLQLGDTKQAELYLKQTISHSPYHHHANNSLALLYLKQGRKEEAVKCFENSLRGSFTLEGFNGLKNLKKESALKLMNYIRHRYRQPDYINFNKFPVPAQCLSYEQTELRKAEHKAYQQALSDEHIKYSRLRDQQEAIAVKSTWEIVRNQNKMLQVKPFLAFAQAMVFSIQKEFEEKLPRLEKELTELERIRLRLKLEFEAGMKEIEKTFEKRIDAIGEGNADMSLDEEICEATNGLINSYLTEFAEVNETKFKKITHLYKGYLNDYLYWIRFASFTKETYELYHYNIVLIMLQVLKKLELTTLNGYCSDQKERSAKTNLEIKKPDCPLPVGIEIPFVIGKISIDCESLGLEAGEGLVFGLEHKMGGETTIAFGPGLSFYSTPKIGKSDFDLNPGIDVGAKGQFFITFEGNTISDGGFLWEAEIDFKGLGKPAELKQNYAWAINKGFTTEGPLTSLMDKAFDIPPDRQLNKNVKPYKPQ
jgi:tetratricopeptide (TPR) repeat protein